MDDRSTMPWDARSMGSLGGLTSWANTPDEDRHKRTAPARAALEAKFLAEADGDPVRAASIRKLHYKRMALKSAQARRERGRPA